MMMLAVYDPGCNAAVLMATPSAPGIVPVVGASVIQFAEVLAFQESPATELARLIWALDESPTVSERLKLAGVAVTAGADTGTFRIRPLLLSAMKRLPE